MLCVRGAGAVPASEVGVKALAGPFTHREVPKFALQRRHNPRFVGPIYHMPFPGHRSVRELDDIERFMAIVAETDDVPFASQSVGRSAYWGKRQLEQFGGAE